MTKAQTKTARTAAKAPATTLAEAAPPSPALPGAVETLPVADLVLSDLNPRRGEPDPAGLAALTENIRAFGLIQNLAGLRTRDGVEIVAGGRRLRALQTLAAEDERFAAAPVRVTDDPDVAETWAASENAVREALHPADEVALYGRMAREGAGVPQIALAHGATEAHVHRRLRLAHLPAPVLAALRADRIGLGHAAVFTLCNSEARALAVLAEIEGQPVGERALRHRLVPDAVGSDDRRAVFVGAEAYRAAGGRITSDLFGGEDVWEDAGLLDDLFVETLAGTARRLAQEGGWLWDEALPHASYLGYYEIEERRLARLYPEPGTLTDEDAERHAALAEAEGADEDLTPEEVAELAALEEAAAGHHTPEQKAHAGIIVHVDARGAVQVTAGLVRPEDKADAIAAGVLPKPYEPAAREDGPALPRSPFSAKLTADLEAIRLTAVQTALMAHPDLALDLLAFGFADDSGAHGHVFGLRPEPGANMPSEPQGLRTDERLHRPERAWHEGRCLTGAEKADAFDAFRKRPRKERMATLAAGLARTLPTGSMIDTVATLAKADVRSVWTPGEVNFLRRMTAGWLDGLLAELLDLEPGDERLAEFRRKRKAEKVGVLRRLFEGHPETAAIWRVTPAQRARIDAWTPEPMRTPERPEPEGAAQEDGEAGTADAGEDRAGTATDAAPATEADEAVPATVH